MLGFPLMLPDVLLLVVPELAAVTLPVFAREPHLPCGPHPQPVFLLEPGVVAEDQPVLVGQAVTRTCSKPIVQK